MISRSAMLPQTMTRHGHRSPSTLRNVQLLPTRLTRRNDFVFGRPPPRGSSALAFSICFRPRSRQDPSLQHPISSISGQSYPLYTCIRHVQSNENTPVSCPVSAYSPIHQSPADKCPGPVPRLGGGQSLTHARPIKASTGITGLAVHPDPLPALRSVYTATLSSLSSIPSTSVYRQATEALTKHRLSAVEGANGDVSKVEAQLEKQVEQILEEAQGEQQLVSKVVEWKS